MRTLTNWFGNSAQSSLANSRLQLDRAGRRVDLVVDGEQLAGRELGLLRAVPGLDRRLARPAAGACITRGTLSSGIGNTTVIGCSCVMTTMPLVSRRVHDVAGVDLAQADAAADRRGDARVRELQLARCRPRPGPTLTVPSYWRTSDSCVSTCCLAIESCASSVW